MKIIVAAFFLLFYGCVCAQNDKAFIIGISQYTEVNSLKYADADATQYPNRLDSNCYGMA